MKIELLHFEGCPNHEALLPRTRAILQREGIEIDVSVRRVDTEEEAVRLGFLGSPTVRVDRHDVEPAATERRDFGLKCRLYQTPDGLRGMPPDEWILAALRDRPQEG